MLNNQVSLTFPSQLSGKFARRPEELLLLCFYDPASISTVPETVAFMQANSEFSITVLNLFEHRNDSGFLTLSPRLNIDKFKGVVVHNSVSYNVDNLWSLDRLLEKPLKLFSGAKILMKQDENYRFREVAKYIGDVDYDLVFTCLPKEAISLVYPENIAGSPRFQRMYTGYVTPTLRQIDTTGVHRPIDIGYRGSIQPLSFGRLAYEKRKIGEDILRLLDGRGLNLDISSRWEDRLGAGIWFQFLASCKATLGAESGASVFDLKGDLESRCAKAEARLGPFAEGADYAESYLSELAELEGDIYYNQISPRHFEAAATRTLQIMYPGKYSEIFLPGRHFLSLDRDCSNIDNVVDHILDESRRKEIVECAYEEVIQSQKYWIETFVKDFDEQVSDVLSSKEALLRPAFRIAGLAKNVLLIAAHEPSLDPRLGWIVKGAPQGMRIVQLGVLPPGSSAYVDGSDKAGTVIAEPRQKFSRALLTSLFRKANSNEAVWSGISELSFIFFALELDELEFSELFGAPVGNERIAQFKWYLNYILDTTATILSVAERIRGVDAVIATDLDTLPAALIIKGLFGVQAVYDAHEYWPEADPASFEFEKQFWVAMERRLVSHVEYRQTVSPGLATLMSEQYRCDFSVVPNCEPNVVFSDFLGKSSRIDGQCRFIFQGNFAPCRGLDLLIDAWPDADQQAILVLRGPDNPYKDTLIDLSRGTGLLGTRIIFLDPVAENQLVEASRDGDVGLVPYTPTGKNYTHCCPNKISQYMAANLPVLANNTTFVKFIVEESRAGIVVDFSRRQDLLHAIHEFLGNPELRMTMGNNGNAYFCEKYNWGKVSHSLYSNLEKFVKNRKSAELEIFPSRIQKCLYKVPPAPKIFGLVLPTKREPDSDQSIRKTGCAEPAEPKAIHCSLALRIWRLLPTAIRIRLGPAIRRTFGI